MSDRSEIQALINEYTYRLDRGEFDRFGELFEKGEWYLSGDESTFALSGKVEVAEWLRANMHTYDNGSLNTKHATVNVTIDVEEGAETASAQMYLIVFQGVPPEFPLQCIFCGRYEDEYVKDEGAWRFAKRTIFSDVVGEIRFHAKAWGTKEA